VIGARLLSRQHGMEIKALPVRMEDS
jgi:hypothetical protein